MEALDTSLVLMISKMMILLDPPLADKTKPWRTRQCTRQRLPPTTAAATIG